MKNIPELTEIEVLEKTFRTVKRVAYLFITSWAIFLFVFIAVALSSGCASYNERYDPQMDLSLGATLHEEYRNNSTAAIGQVAVTQKVVPAWDWLRAGVSHESEPSTLKDNGVTWVKGTIRFGAGK